MAVIDQLALLRTARLSILAVALAVLTSSGALAQENVLIAKCLSGAGPKEVAALAEATRKAEELRWNQVRDAATAFAHQERAKLLTLASEPSIHGFVRLENGEQVPVILCTRESYPKLKNFMKTSLGIAVELDNGSAKNNHGRDRFSTRIHDFGTPGRRFAEQDPQKTGIAARPMDKWIEWRDTDFRQGGLQGKAFDERPFRMIEVLYPLSPEDVKTSEAYSRARHAGIWRVDFYHTMGNQSHEPLLLCHPEGGAEHCWSFGMDKELQFHTWAIYDALFHKIGIKETSDQWFARPEVMLLQEKARALIADYPLDEGKPETWVGLGHDFLIKNGLFKLIQDIAPKNLNDTQIEQLVNFTYAERAIRDYGKLLKKLDIKEHARLDYANRNAGAILVYDGENTAGEAFDHATYDFRGAQGDGFHNDGKNQPIQKQR